MCHTVSGTAAAGTNGPDLTHFASRQTLGVGAAPMSRASIAAWMSDPQRLKPGTHMPAIGLSPSDEEAVVEYLETLK